MQLAVHNKSLSKDMMQGLKMLRILNLNIVPLIIVIVTVVVTITLNDCVHLEDEGWINTSHHQYNPIFCPIQGRNKTHTLMYNCYNDIFLNCPSKKKKAACNHSAGHPVEMICVNLSHKEADIKDTDEPMEGTSHYTSATDFSPPHPEWTQWIGLTAICLLMIILAALVVFSCGKDIL
ncbi:uncharacterized protein [Haliotis cracherodii]|uniref:uncharacterized protein n=1 Tax=Haliotis cracherodii TaxID=6455 RepID=UPI0039E96AD3